MAQLAALAVKAPNVMEQFTAGQNQANRNQAFKIEEHKSMVEDMQAGVMAADTPEKWARYVQQVTPLYGENVVAPYRNFESRNQLLGQLQSTLGERKFAEGKRVGDRDFDALQSHRASTLAAASDKVATDREYRTERDAVKDAKFAQTHGLKKDIADTKAADSSKPDFKNENALRKDYQAVSKDFRGVRDAYTRLESSANNPSPAGDLAMIFNYMKILDPGSVVRESEFATAAASGSYGERIKAAVDKVTSGHRLSEVMRSDFLSRGQQLYAGRKLQFDQTSDQFRETANAYGMDPDRVVLDYSRAQPDEGIKADKNAGANAATPIQLESESGIQESMLGKYVRINGITFKVDMPDMKDYKAEVEKPVSERRDLLDPLGIR